MRRSSVFSQIIIGLACLLGQIGNAEPSFITFPSDIDWVTRRSDHFEVIYRRGEEGLAERALKMGEKAHRLLAPIFPKGPDLTRMVLADFQDSTNGYALNFPYSHIVIFVSPPEAVSQLSSLDDWLYSIILHEYVHILHIYPASGLWKVMRTIFGSIVVPNGLMPTHFHEGMATFFETELTDGGRGRSPSFNMERRMAVEAGVWNRESLPLDRYEATFTVWPQGVAPYFYGYHLTEELWARKGRKGIYDLTQSYSSNWPYLLGGPLNEVHGTTFEKLWDDIYRTTGERARKEIAAIKRSPLSELKPLTRTKFHKWDVLFSPDGKRAAYRKTDPEDGSALMIIDPDDGKQLDRIEISAGATVSLCWGAKDGKDTFLFPKVSKKNNYAVNFIGGYQTKEKREFRLTLNEGKPVDHVHGLACNDNFSNLLLYQESAGKGTIREFYWKPDLKDPDGTLTLKREWALPTGAWVSSLLYSEAPWFALREGLKTSLYRWDGKVPSKILEVPAHVYNLRRGRKSGEILAIATIDGRDEVWAFQTERKEAEKVISLLGGAIGFDERKGKYLVARYEHGGYDVVKATPVASARVKVSSLHPERKTKSVSLASDEAITISAPESYSPLSTLYPRTWIPSMLFVPDGIEFAVWIPGFDVAQKHFYDIFGGYDTRGLAFALVNYNYRFSENLTLIPRAYLAPSYLLSTKTIQQRWGGSLGLRTEITAIPLGIEIGAAYRRIERSSLGSSDQSVGPTITLDYKTGFKQHALDISPTAGTELSVSHSQFFEAFGSDKNYFSSIFGYDQYLEAPWWKGHVFYSALRAGFTEGNSLYNSYFTFGGELLFSQGRGYFLNRGFQPEILISRRIANWNLEYRFPLMMVDRGIGLWPLHLKRVHAALVADVTTRELGPRHPQDPVYQPVEKLFKIFYTSAGAELRSDWTLFFYMPTLIRLGLYHGFGPGGEALYTTLGFEASL